MAASDIIDNWIPVEWNGDVIMRVHQASAVEAFGLSVPMGTETKRVLREQGMNVSTGLTYTADTSANDYVTLTAVKFTGSFQVEEDDLSDAASVVNTLDVKSRSWATSYATYFDNACLAVTAAGNGGTVPFNSVYYALTQNNSTTGYTANANIVTWDDDFPSIAASGADGTSFYEKASSALGLVESGRYFSELDALVIAHPTFRQVVRNALDGQGRPIFQQGLNGNPDLLFGLPVHWSYGAKTSATASKTPGGNPVIVFVGDKNLMLRGDRSAAEAMVSKSRAQDTTDTLGLKLRVRKAFAVGNENGFAVLVRSSD
jgi:hypothetical protein